MSRHFMYVKGIYIYVKAELHEFLYNCKMTVLHGRLYDKHSKKYLIIIRFFSSRLTLLIVVIVTSFNTLFLLVA